MRGCTATFLVITFVVAGFMGTLNKRTCSSPITVVLKAQSDNYVSENNPTSCYGSEVVLNVRSYFDGQNHNNHRTYIYFDINLIPENVKILSALLWLYKNPEGANPGVRDILAFRVADAWDEYTQNWDTQPNVSQKPTASSKVDGPLKWYSWNLTQDVTAWYDGSAFNYGTMLRDAAENSRTDYASIFLSREASHPENPYLQVEYIESAESTAATSGELTAVSLISRFAWILLAVFAAIAIFAALRRKIAKRGRRLDTVQEPRKNYLGSGAVTAKTAAYP